MTSLRLLKSASCPTGPAVVESRRDDGGGAGMAQVAWEHGRFRGRFFAAFPRAIATAEELFPAPCGTLQAFVIRAGRLA
ncbi:hypothetical protein [Frateuria sp. Soil773]|uniref:hypothetical protein n=1 Tax=Frateuria sp. Soil773 TaxID=1736407 RepID=UPI0012FCB862|nr:hypothetical protein [Frateuria sp. Soil773]